MDNNFLNFINYEGSYEDFSSRIDINMEEPPELEEFHQSFEQSDFYRDLQPSTLPGFASNAFGSHFSNEVQHIPPHYEQMQADMGYLQQSGSERKDDNSSESDDLSAKASLPDPMSNKSRRIMKREQAKQRNQTRVPKITAEAVKSGEIPSKYVPEGFDQPDLDEKAKKKMLQMIRNRISAQNSRDRKKCLMEKLEDQQKMISQENLQLKNELRQLKEANKALIKENQELRRSLMNSFGQKHENFLQNDVLQNDFGESSDRTGLSSESGNNSGSTSPIIRRSFRSGGFMKYSIALATIFAVMMFTGINPPANSMMSSTALMRQGISQPIGVVKGPGRMLEERYDEPYVNENGSLESLDSSSFVKIEQNTNTIEAKMGNSRANSRISPLTKEEDADVGKSLVLVGSEKFNHVSEELGQYPFIRDLHILQNNFNTEYMSKFFSELKIMDSVAMKNDEFMQVVPTSMEINFPSYLRTNKHKQLSNLFRGSDNNHQLAISHSSDIKNSIVGSDNFSSFFCPSAYEFQVEEEGNAMEADNFNTEIDPERKLRLQKAEWIQLFVPKSNVSIATSRGPNDIFIHPSSINEKEDNAILEVWCKVFFVRELPSGF